MKITLTTHGGLAAGIRRPPRVVESSELSESAARELARLVAAVKNAPVAEDASSGRARDAMSYTISVDDDGKTKVLRQSDTAMSPAFAAE